MTRNQDNIVGLLCFILAAVAIGGTVWVAREATSVVSATRVALDAERKSHDETLAKLGDARVELAECREH